MMFVLFRNQFWKGFGHIFQMRTLHSLVMPPLWALVFQYTWVLFFHSWHMLYFQTNFFLLPFRLLTLYCTEFVKHIQKAHFQAVLNIFLIFILGLSSAKKTRLESDNTDQRGATLANTEHFIFWYIASIYFFSCIKVTDQDHEKPFQYCRRIYIHFLNSSTVI
jgi:hypothetical protein